MEKITDFIKNNLIAVVIGAFFYGLFVYLTMTGNRMCDCQSTEQYRPSQGATRSGVHHYYHK